MIPRPFFDRPLWTDPLVWFGMVVGLSVSIIVGLQRNVRGEDLIWQVLVSTFAFTWWIAGLLLSTIRHQVRRRRAIKDRQASSAS